MGADNHYHGLLGGLSNDDHAQYYNAARLSSVLAAYSTTSAIVAAFQPLLGYAAANDANVLHTTGNEVKTGTITASGFGTGQVANYREVFGTGSVVTSLGGFAAGYEASAGANSVAVGTSAVATSASVALGYGATAIGGSSFALGLGALADGSAGVAIGTYARAYIHGIAVGINANTGIYCTAIGQEAAAMFLNSIAIGHNATTTKSNQIVMGAAGFEMDELRFVGTSNSIRIANAVKHSLNSAASDPTTSDFVSGDSGWWKNTASGEIRFWVNDSGTMKKSAALT